MKDRRLPAPKLLPMRPTGFEPATFGLKDRRSLGPRKDPLTTELRALDRNDTRARGSERPGRGRSLLGLGAWI